ncbi:MAG: radical SAM protein [candidate division WOR-3 bacterium]
MCGEIIKARKYRYIDTGNKLLQFDPQTSELTEINITEIPDDGCTIIKSVPPPVSSLILHVTKRCNLRCRHCYIDAKEDNDDELSLEKIYSILEEASQMGILGVAISCGEPMLRKDLPLILERSFSVGLYTDLLTNGVLLNEGLIKKIKPFVQRITLSLDGLQEEHDWIRGHGNFQIVRQKLQMLQKASVPIAITTLVNYRNIHTLNDIAQFIHQFGVDKWSLTLPRLAGRIKFSNELYHFTIKEYFVNFQRCFEIIKHCYSTAKNLGIEVLADSSLIPLKILKREKAACNTYLTLYKHNRVCWDSNIVIMPNGDFVPCLFFENTVYGNINNYSLRHLYYSSKRRKLAQKFIRYGEFYCAHLIQNMKGGDKNEATRKK